MEAAPFHDTDTFRPDDYGNQVLVVRDGSDEDQAWAGYEYGGLTEWAPQVCLCVS